MPDPVTFDFSKSQPVDPVQFDFSKSVPLDAGDKTPPVSGVGPVGRFAWNLAAGLNPLPALNLIKNPVDSGKNLLAAHLSESEKADQELAAGNYAPAVGHKLASVFPLMGPAAANVGEQIRSGDVAGGLGQGAALLSPFAAEALPDARLGITPNLTPEQQSAVQAGRAAGVPIDVGTASGSDFWRGTRDILQKQPFSSGIVSKGKLAGQEGLADALRSTSAGISPGGTNKLMSGSGAQANLGAEIDRLNSVADSSYKQLRQFASDRATPVTIPGQPSAAESTMGTDPQDWAIPPTTKYVNGPTNYSGVKAALQPLYDKITQQIPEAQRQASPGLQALKQIVNASDSVDIDTAIRDLSAIQNISRTDAPALRDASKGIAATIVPKLRSAIDDAAQSLGPDAKFALDAGRQATKDKYAIANLAQKQLPKNPVQLVNYVTAPEGRGQQALSAIAAVAPDSIPEIGRSVLEGIIGRSTQEGGFTKAASAQNAWNKMTPETKTILFGQNTAQKLDSLFELGRMQSVQANPSQTAGVAGIMATGIEMATNPLKTVTALIGARKLSRILMSPNGPELVAKGITLPVGSFARKAIFTDLAARLAGEESKPTPFSGDSLNLTAP